MIARLSATQGKSQTFKLDQTWIYKMHCHHGITMQEFKCSYCIFVRTGHLLYYMSCIEVLDATQKYMSSLNNPLNMNKTCFYFYQFLYFNQNTEINKQMK